ncbi:PEP-CTERM-box response regulator transcription factor [Candidatus Poribacteria bacterium]|nr:MAG: PEP-CTERM-box response regulator transcription factor [Candidatus Poribacteria bacterium]
MSKPLVLVVDDEEGIRLQMKWALAGEFDVALASNEAEAMEILKSSKPNAVLLDIALSPSDEKGGLRLLEEMLKVDPTIKVIMITGHDTKENALEAISRGAHDFLSKPIDLDELKVVLRRAVYIQQLERENIELRRAVSEEVGIIASCPKMMEVMELVRKVAPADVPVLITGESGTGKELIAREIHRLSKRAKGEFVAINCGAIPRELLESELFGHEKGAFTGAVALKKGKFELADGGTLFLDEVTELTPDLQVKLLRFLQEYTIERVGGLKPIKLDVRVIAATNRDIHEEVKSGRFREDLYYRLNVISIHLPPLRERGEDILLIANAYLNRYAREFGRDIRGFTSEAIDRMMSYSWPGNIRELQNKIRRAVLIASGKMITPEDLDLTDVEVEKGFELRKRVTLQEARDELEIRMVREALARSKGNVSKAAKELGVSRATLYDLLKKHRIDPKEFKST